MRAMMVIRLSLSHVVNVGGSVVSEDRLDFRRLKTRGSPSVGERSSDGERRRVCKSSAIWKSFL